MGEINLAIKNFLFKRYASSVDRKIPWFRDYLLFSVILIVLGLDFSSKYFVSTTFFLGESWPAEGFLRITYHTNSGTAFGLLQSATTFLIIASIFAIVFLIYFYRKYAMNDDLLRISIGMLLGGALGNLWERVTQGKVVDFFDVGAWPIFNVADSAISVGITILVIKFVLNEFFPSFQNHVGDE